MSDGHNEDIGGLKTSVDFLREGQERLEHRMDEGFTELKELFREGHGKHSERIRSLEKSRAWLTGLFAAFTAIWGAVTTWIFGQK